MLKSLLRLSPMLLLALLGQTKPATPPASAPTTQTAAKPSDLYALTPDQFFKLPESQARIGKETINVALLEAAIFQQTNRARTDNKLPTFRHSWALNLCARRYSQEMIDMQFFDHVSPN